MYSHNLTPTKTDWSTFYAPGPEILSYLHHVVSKYKLTHINLQHELIHAQWDSSSSKWHIRLKRPSSTCPTEFEEIEDTADVLFSGMGGLSRWSWPDIEGLQDYKGTLYHSAQWDLMGGKTWYETVKDWGEKTVGVIGVVCFYFYINNIVYLLMLMTVVPVGLFRNTDRPCTPASGETPVQLRARKDMALSSLRQ